MPPGPFIACSWMRQQGPAISHHVMPALQNRTADLGRVQTRKATTAASALQRPRPPPEHKRRQRPASRSSGHTLSQSQSRPDRWSRGGASLSASLARACHLARHLLACNRAGTSNCETVESRCCNQECMGYSHSRLVTCFLSRVTCSTCELEFMSVLFHDVSVSPAAPVSPKKDVHAGMQVNAKSHTGGVSCNAEASALDDAAMPKSQR